jgi:hypothetical protein
MIPLRIVAIVTIAFLFLWLCAIIKQFKVVGIDLSIIQVMISFAFLISMLTYIRRTFKKTPTPESK